MILIICLQIVRALLNNKQNIQMPQLDKITFLSQFFWLSFFYLGFYFLIYKYFLPKMSRTLKFRKRRINTSQQGVTSMGEESDKVGSSYQALLSTGLTTCKSVFNQNFKDAEEWLFKTVSQTNQTRLKSTNSFYISSLGERSISQKLSINHLLVDVSEKTSFALLIGKLKGLKKENYSTLPQLDKLKGNKSRSALTESSGKNKTRLNKEQEQAVGKDSSTKSKARSSTKPSNKNKTSKKQ